MAGGGGESLVLRSGSSVLGGGEGGVDRFRRLSSQKSGRGSAERRGPSIRPAFLGIRRERETKKKAARAIALEFEAKNRKSARNNKILSAWFHRFPRRRPLQTFVGQPRRPAIRRRPNQIQVRPEEPIPPSQVPSALFPFRSATGRIRRRRAEFEFWAGKNS